MDNFQTTEQDQRHEELNTYNGEGLGYSTRTSVGKTTASKIMKTRGILANEWVEGSVKDGVDNRRN
jgi:hypothetical protein